MIPIENLIVGHWYSGKRGYPRQILEIKRYGGEENLPDLKYRSVNHLDGWDLCFITTFQSWVEQDLGTKLSAK
jgi:hypothetical protein